MALDDYSSTEYTGLDTLGLPVGATLTMKVMIATENAAT